MKTRTDTIIIEATPVDGQLIDCRDACLDCGGDPADWMSWDQWLAQAPVAGPLLELLDCDRLVGDVPKPGDDIDLRAAYLRTLGAGGACEVAGMTVQGMLLRPTDEGGLVAYIEVNADGTRAAVLGGGWRPPFPILGFGGCRTGRVPV